ncbi:Putative ribosomal pseudouridine synthase [hydrothermal vent metagenome]|uniref:Putative ribosomal pseudouridine synthase n=1 Tax=hydrothermal vent metagenome TaxID=652676 RepID=A0A1W1D5M3_9ZZZZ
MPFVKKKFYAKKKEKAFLFLIKELGYTQKEAQRFIAKGRLIYQGKPMVKASQEIEGEIEFIYFEPTTKGLLPTYKEEQFVVFDKPSGLLIHPQTRHTPYSLIDELKYQFGKDANITHRIDQETSGLVLCATNKESERELKLLFQERNISKKYLAIVHGKLEQQQTIDAPLLRTQDKESAMVRMVIKVDPNGKNAKTTIQPLKYFEKYNMTLVECSPHTGRQHQIRVHLFHINHPIVGDPIYGQTQEDMIKFLDRNLTKEERIQKSGASRLLLHASELEFTFANKKYHIKSNIDFAQEGLEFIKQN